MQNNSDGSFVIALALHDANLDVIGNAAVAGTSVSAEQATSNDHILLNQSGPKRLPRIGAGVGIEKSQHGRAIYHPQGLGALTFPNAQRTRETRSE